MAGVIPELTNGAKVVRDGTGACVAPSGVSNAYCPPAAFTTTCEVKALPNDCTARITPAQINAVVSEMLALAVKLTPGGTWNCASVTNLADAFAAWRAGFGAVDNVTIGGAGTTASPYHVIADGVVAAICSDNSAHDQLTACLRSTDAGNGLALGADGGLFGAGTATDGTIDGTGAAADPFRVNLANLIAVICASNGAHDGLAACLISTDANNGLRRGTDGGLLAPRGDFYNAGLVTGTANAWAAALVPRLIGNNLEENSTVVATMSDTNTLTTVTATFDGITRNVRLGDGFTAPPVGYFTKDHAYMFRYDSVQGTWATVADLTALTGPTTVTTPDGNTVVADAPPTASDGLVGDYWYDIPNNRWYGPKTAAGWAANDFIGSDIYNLGLLGGTATAYTAVSPRPDMPNAGPRDGSIAYFRVNVTNTGNNPTLTTSGGTARGLRRGDGANLIPSDLIANHDIMAIYNGPTARWRCVWDLTTGTRVGTDDNLGPELLAQGSGTYANNATLATLTDLKHTRYTLVMQCEEGPPTATGVLSDDNGATWYTGGNDYTKQEMNGGNWTISSSISLPMQPTGAGSNRLQGAPVMTPGTLNNSFARLAIDGFWPGASCGPYSRGDTNYSDTLSSGGSPEPLFHASVARVYNAVKVRFGNPMDPVATQTVRWKIYGEY